MNDFKCTYLFRNLKNNTSDLNKYFKGFKSGLMDKLTALHKLYALFKGFMLCKVKEFGVVRNDSLSRPPRRSSIGPFVCQSREVGKVLFSVFDRYVANRGPRRQIRVDGLFHVSFSWSNTMRCCLILNVTVASTMDGQN